MNKRIAIWTAAVVASALPLLAACGNDSGPLVDAPAPSTSPVTAPSTSAPAGPASTPSVSPSPESSTEPSADPAKDTAAVKAASEKFVKTTLTIGYPNKDFDAYLNRMKSLMTEAGYAELMKETEAKTSIEKQSKRLYAQRTRTSPKFLSDVKVSSLTADTAKASVEFQNRMQQLSGGEWKTVRTATKDTAPLELVKQGDKWLVDHS